MVEITDGAGLERWLKGKPRGWAIVLAARSALRVLPTLSKISVLSGNLSRDQRTEIILPVLRATSVLWASTKYPARGNDLRDALTGSAAAAAAAVSYHPASSVVTAASAAESAAATNAERAAYYAAKAASSHAAAAAFATGSGSYGPSAAWHALSEDLYPLALMKDIAKLAALPLYLPDIFREKSGGPPEWISVSWDELKRLLLQHESEHWQVWIDWYEARLYGRDPWPEDVEVACALIPDEIWKQGPAVVNAEIRRIRDGGASEIVLQAELFASSGATFSSSEETSKREQIEQLIDAVSPKPFLTDDGKLDAGRNPKFDRVVSSVDLPSLPMQQQALIRAILSDFGANAPKSVRTALEEYRDELKARGLQPILGLLNNMASIVRAACNANNAAIEWLDEGAQKAVELFFANHDLLVKHFPLDAEREALMARVFVDEDAAEGRALSQPSEDVAKAAKEAHAAGLVTDDFVDLVEKKAAFIKAIATEPREMRPSKIAVRDGDMAVNDGPVAGIFATQEDRFVGGVKPASTKKRMVLMDYAFYERAANLCSSLLTIASSPQTIALYVALRAAADALRPFIGL